MLLNIEEGEAAAVGFVKDCHKADTGVHCCTLWDQSDGNHIRCQHLGHGEHCGIDTWSVFSHEDEVPSLAGKYC